jgi:hypothetical protein
MSSQIIRTELWKEEKVNKLINDLSEINVLMKAGRTVRTYE